MQFFKYYYYRLYSYYSNGGSIPFFSTFCLIFIFGLINLITIINLLTLIFGFQFGFFPTIKSGTISYFWSLLLLIPCYWIFNLHLKKRGMHELIMNEFKQETLSRRRVNGWLLIFYFVASGVLFVLILWLRQKIRGY